MNTNETVKVDKVSELLPKVDESRPTWIARVVASVLAWLKKPRSRIGPGAALVAGCLLAQGCATAAWHNYQVAQAEQSEREQLEAGKIPLVKSNADLIRDNWFGYVVGITLDAGAAYCVYRYVERDDRENHTTYNETNNYLPPEPVGDGAGDIAP